MRAWFIASAVALITVPAALGSQTITDIYLFDIHNEYSLVAHVTGGKEYDSQPYFTPDAKAVNRTGVLFWGRYAYSL
jgi:hypothetical protein